MDEQEYINRRLAVLEKIVALCEEDEVARLFCLKIATGESILEEALYNIIKFQRSEISGLKSLIPVQVANGKELYH